LWSPYGSTSVARPKRWDSDGGSAPISGWGDPDALLDVVVQAGMYFLSTLSPFGFGLTLGHPSRPVLEKLPTPSTFPVFGCVTGWSLLHATHDGAKVVGDSPLTLESREQSCFLRRGSRRLWRLALSKSLPRSQVLGLVFLLSHDSGLDGLVPLVV
jgi:hypothetical protein